MTTLLVIDIGNTNVSIGVFDYPSGEKGQLSHHWRIGTHSDRTSDEISLTVSALFQHENRQCSEVTDVIISSVVPPVLPIFVRVCLKLFEKSPLVVGPGIRTGMPVRYENPREVGADRIVNALAAFELIGGPVIAVDFGTATTFDCVSKDGEYLGGVIFPGMHTSMEALFERASMLHGVEIARPKQPHGLYRGLPGLPDFWGDRLALPNCIWCGSRRTRKGHILFHRLHVGIDDLRRFISRSVYWWRIFRPPGI